MWNYIKISNRQGYTDAKITYNTKINHIMVFFSDYYNYFYW